MHYVPKQSNKSYSFRKPLSHTTITYVKTIKQAVPTRQTKISTIQCDTSRVYRFFFISLDFNDYIGWNKLLRILNHSIFSIMVKSGVWLMKHRVYLVPPATLAQLCFRTWRFQSTSWILCIAMMAIYKTQVVLRNL